MTRRLEKISAKEAMRRVTLELIEYVSTIKGSSKYSFFTTSLSVPSSITSSLCRGRSLSYVPGHRSLHKRISL